MELARNVKNADEARPAIEEFRRTGTLPEAYKKANNRGVTYRTRQFDRTETRIEIVRWVMQNLRPFAIVEDDGFRLLMKTGRPEYYLPSASTVACDVHLVFTRTRVRLAKMLQVSIRS